MKNSSTKWLGLMLLVLTGCRGTTEPAVAQNGVTPEAGQTALDAYIAKDEPEYAWEEIPNAGENALQGEVNLRLTSQVWQGRPWRHRLQMIVPQDTRESPLQKDAAVIWVTYGTGNVGETIMAQSLSRATGAITVNVFGVPNQPLFERTEDALIAHTFVKFLETGDPTWPLLFPMTKSVVKAMDAVSEWSQQKQGRPITRFIIAGASKRGWTAYLTAAADKRVVGIIPIVYDNLNIVAQLENQGQIWGGLSEQMGDYSKLDLPRQAKTPIGKLLLSQVDPYAFRSRLTMPKLMINATNDRFWPHNSSTLYRDELPQPWNVFYLPNAGHMLGAGQLQAGLAAASWARRVLRGDAIPQVKLDVQTADGKRTFNLELTGAPEDQQLNTAKLWYATAPSADLRNAKWQSVDMEIGPNAVTAIIPETPSYTAAFANINMGDQRLPIRLTSPMWESAAPAAGAQ